MLVYIFLTLIIFWLFDLILVLLALLAAHLFTHDFFLYLHLLVESPKFFFRWIILLTLLCAPTRSN